MQNKILQFLKSNFYTIYWIFNPDRTIDITPQSVYNYFQAQYRKTLGFNNLEVHIREQIIYRSKISACASLEHCSFCGCPMEELIYGNDSCKNTPPCFPKMMNKEEWLEFTKTNNL